jgi:hypothetical protein
MPEQNPAQEPAKPVKDQSEPIPSTSTKQTQVVPTAHSSNEKENKAGRDNPKWTDVAVAFFTVCLVAVAIWQGHIFNKQWEEMHSGGTDTHALAEAAEAQADAAKAQADETKAQVDKLTESLKKTDVLIKEATAQANATNLLAVQAQRSADYAQQAIKTSVEADRPWVGMSTFNVTNFVEGQTAKIAFNFVNSGKRPASASVTYGTTLVKSLPAFPLFGNRQHSVDFALPGSGFGTTLDYEVPRNAFAEWKRDRLNFFIVAEVVYTDVGTNAAYITHYCAFYDPSKKDQPFPLCTRYNEAK